MARTPTKPDYFGHTPIWALCMAMIILPWMIIISVAVELLRSRRVVWKYLLFGLVGMSLPVLTYYADLGMITVVQLTVWVVGGILCLLGAKSEKGPLV